MILVFATEDGFGGNVFSRGAYGVRNEWARAEKAES
jgi:hypothetical protein